nr:sensor histidine kinase [uncultured Blautia sp.]
MEKWRKRIGQWRFDKKIQALITAALIITTLIVQIVSTMSSVTSLRKKSEEMLQARNATMAENFEGTLERYKSLAIAMVLDRSIQKYMECKDKQSEEYSAIANDAKNVMSSCQNMHSDMNFIAVVSYQMDDYLYRGFSNLSDTGFQKNYRQDYKKAKNVQTCSIKVGFSNAYFKGKRYTLNVYFPIYNVQRISSEKGLLCMNFSNPLMNQILKDKREDSGQNIELIDMEGMIVASANIEHIGNYANYEKKLNGTQGSFNQNGRLYIYQKVSGWNYYIVSSLASVELYKPSIRITFLMTGVLIVLLLLCLNIVKRIIRKLYRPLDKVVRKMDDVAAGSLKVRINEENMGEDFVKLATGFNSMMEEIMVLMEQVKMEQHQIEQIRFNALQSQIQPHFLYNTLECIHWQAVADGNKEISVLVKALARYYRICLSKGHDVIPLNMEVEHVQNYLIIQNMRYDDIIGSSVDIDPKCKNAMIPKLTLQPLIENSIYHGIKIKEGKQGNVSLCAVRKENLVKIFIEDTGTGMTQEQIDGMNQCLSEYDEGFGYGVRNVNKRIELLYGQEYGLHYLSNEYGGVTVEIVLPYMTEVEPGILQGDIINV